MLFNERRDVETFLSPEVFGVEDRFNVGLRLNVCDIPWKHRIIEYEENVNKLIDYRVTSMEEKLYRRGL